MARILERDIYDKNGVLLLAKGSQIDAQSHSWSRLCTLGLASESDIKSVRRQHI